jgi:hypothetical protein
MLLINNFFTQMVALIFIKNQTEIKKHKKTDKKINFEPIILFRIR